MEIELWLAFVAASTIMLVIPGPTIITVTAYATSHGRKAILPLVVAVSLGDLSVISLSVLGLGSLLAVSSMAFNFIKIIGGLYLIYLGFRMLRSALSSQQPSRETQSGRGKSIFFNTWLVTALNPKGILFFSAFLPQFIQTEMPIAPQLSVLTITFVCLAAINTLAYAVLATTASELINSSSAKRKFDLGGGIAMSIAGLWALTAKQTA